MIRTTACKWDSVIPFPEMWQCINGLIKKNGAVVLFSQQPFTSTLICSNLKQFRYTWIWDKGYGTGFANCNKMPMKGYEDVCVFYEKLPTYNPQGLIEIEPKKRTRGKGGAGAVMGTNGTEGKEYVSSFTNYPKGMISTKKEKTIHPTGKSLAVMRYLIKTYTNEGDTILDFTMGSGSTICAALNANRKSIGIERDDHYFQVAKNRIENHPIQRKLF